MHSASHCSCCVHGKQLCGCCLYDCYARRVMGMGWELTKVGAIPNDGLAEPLFGPATENAGQMTAQATVVLSARSRSQEPSDQLVGWLGQAEIEGG